MLQKIVLGLVLCSTAFGSSTHSGFGISLLSGVGFSRYHAKGTHRVNLLGIGDDVQGFKTKARSNYPYAGVALSYGDTLGSAPIWLGGQIEAGYAPSNHYSKLNMQFPGMGLRASVETIARRNAFVGGHLRIGAIYQTHLFFIGMGPSFRLGSLKATLTHDGGGFVAPGFFNNHTTKKERVFHWDLVLGWHKAFTDHLTGGIVGKVTWGQKIRPVYKPLFRNNFTLYHQPKIGQTNYNIGLEIKYKFF